MLRGLAGSQRGAVLIHIAAMRPKREGGLGGWPSRSQGTETRPFYLGLGGEGGLGTPVVS